MAFMASGEHHGYSHDAGETQPRHETKKRARRRSARHLSLLSFALSAILFVGLAAIVLLDIAPAERETRAARPGALTYAAPPTPAIDGLTQKPDIWTEVADPVPLFKVRSLEVVDLPASYGVREHGRGGRLDLLSFGDFAGPGLHLHLVVYRMGGEAAPPSTLFVDLARRAAESGVGVTGIGTTITHDTKFGTAEIAGVELSLDGRERACQAFRVDVAATDATRQILGWTCDDEPVTAPEIACFIDHLALTEAATEPRLVALFETAARRQRPECGGVPLPVPPKGA
ncbi:hypothetical protein ACUSIJ_01615 [Pseudochelatococcus sp. B33]